MAAACPRRCSSSIQNACRAAGTPTSISSTRHACLAISRATTIASRVAPRFVNTFDDLEVEAVQDGVILPYGGDPRDVLPVLHVRAAIATSPPWRPLSWAL